ncbi:MAG: NAD(P)/FAD-dependent oxidoreductase [Planctomycetota bacterium]|nr:NAD(P)/FAD-dependent oxidoreductase [Planctomycetota bacterium]
MRSSHDTDDVAVIGAGAAGLLAGIAAARAGARVSVYERNARPGRKIAISGGGRCNFSNTLPPREFVRRFGDPNARRLGRALSELPPGEIAAMLARRGVEAAVERGWRLYARSGRGEDVVEALLAEFRDSGARLVPGVRVSAVEYDTAAGIFTLAAAGCSKAPAAAGGAGSGKFPADADGPSPDGARASDPRAEVPPESRRSGQAGAAGGGPVRPARCVVICTGGISYPETGSTGDGYEWARRFGHRVSDLKAGLVGLKTAETWPMELQGLSWPDAEATLTPLPPALEADDGSGSAGRESRGRQSAPGGSAAPEPAGREPAAGGWAADPSGIANPLQTGPTPPGGRRAGRGARGAVERGEILFAHFGVSGPAILDLSNAFAAMGCTTAALTLDFFPDTRRDRLDSILLERFAETPGRLLPSALEGLLPRRLAEKAAELCGAAAREPVCRLAREKRMALLDFLKGARLTVTGTRGIERSEITCGGVSWDDLDPSTLESRIRPGLFFAGEILDIAGRCGGFNMQAAFSTGWLAGRSAAIRALQSPHAPPRD